MKTTATSYFAKSDETWELGLVPAEHPDLFDKFDIEVEWDTVDNSNFEYGSEALGLRWTVPLR
jgi:hypothetical protein